MLKTSAAATLFSLALIFALTPLAQAQTASPDLNAKLIEAARSGDAVAVQRLLHEGANIEARDERGSAALYIAASYERTEIVKLLLEKGAYIEVRNDYGTTPLIEATNKGYAIIVKLLLEKGANVENDERGQRPLARAALMGKYDIVALLLDKGANIEARDNNGWTALIVAALMGRTNIVRLLLEKGANIEARNKDGSTALITAARSGITAAVKLLLEKGADIEARDNFGKSALNAAQGFRRSEVVALLTSSQANPRRQINLGEYASGQEYLDALLQRKYIQSEAGYEYTGYILRHIALARYRTSVNVTIMTVAELGFPQGANLDIIYREARLQGLALCPAEVGPALRLQYSSKSLGIQSFYNQDGSNNDLGSVMDVVLGSVLKIAMEPVRDEYGDLSIFEIGPVEPPIGGALDPLYPNSFNTFSKLEKGNFGPETRFVFVIK